jgi:NTP pyrophosphatase (non-canonical NTP hydrolase)
MTLDEYQSRAFSTARVNWEDRAAQNIPMLGAIGELGSVASELKKIVRDGSAYTEGRASLIEELGDLLWYLAAIATRHDVSLGSLATGKAEATPKGEPYAHVYSLLTAVAALVESVRAHEARPAPSSKRKMLAAVSNALLAFMQVLRRERVSLNEVVEANLQKGESKFGVSPKNAPAPCFDSEYPSYEQLPRSLEIQVLERPRGKGRVEVILRVNGLNVGDRLTDNASKDDGYRFHDVFHLAYAAVLGWSPVVRSIFRVKRKSNSKVDEVQDGARAGIVEEAIAHTVFQYADGHSLLKGLKHIDHGVLLLIKRMVRDLEVESLAMHEWERAIFVGFEAFRALKKNHGGWLVLNAETRSLTFSRNGPVVG